MRRVECATYSKAPDRSSGIGENRHEIICADLLVLPDFFLARASPSARGRARFYFFLFLSELPSDATDSAMRARGSAQRSKAGSARGGVWRPCFCFFCGTGPGSGTERVSRDGCEVRVSCDTVVGCERVRSVNTGP